MSFSAKASSFIGPLRGDRSRAFHFCFFLFCFAGVIARWGASRSSVGVSWTFFGVSFRSERSRAIQPRFPRKRAQRNTRDIEQRNREVNTERRVRTGPTTIRTLTQPTRRPASANHNQNGGKLTQTTKNTTARCIHTRPPTLKQQKKHCVPPTRSEVSRMLPNVCNLPHHETSRTSGS